MTPWDQLHGFVFQLHRVAYACDRTFPENYTEFRKKLLSKIKQKELKIFILIQGTCP